MNILFIEDEIDLAATGVEQLQMMGHTVFPVRTLAGAHEVLEQEGDTIDLVIADHVLPDGRGIDFAIRMRTERPDFQLAIVSGCLSAEDIKRLEAESIAYFRKPLLYRKVLEHLRRERMVGKPIGSPPVQADAVAGCATAEDVGDARPEKRRWGIFRR